MVYFRMVIRLGGGRMEEGRHEDRMGGGDKQSFT